jgi:hypothetical protein
MSDVADPALDRSLRLRRPPALGRPDGTLDLSTLPADAWTGRSVSAAAVRDYCMGPGERGRLDGLRVLGTLDLSSMSFEQPMLFSSCLFSGPVILNESRLGQIEFTGCTFARELSAKNLGCRALAISSTVATARVDLRYADISGPLELQDSWFQSPAPESLDLSGAVIGRSATLARAKVRGAVMAVGLTVHGLLDCTDITIEGTGWTAGEQDPYGEPRRILESDQVAFVADSASIDGWLRMPASQPGRCVVTGLVRMRGAQAAALNCDGATFRNADSICLNLERTKFANSVLLRGFTSEGTIRFFAAEIGDALELIKASVSAPKGIAIHAGRVQVKGPVLLRDEFKAHGAVRFYNAAIGSFVDCSGANFQCADQGALPGQRWDLPAGDTALSFENSEIGGDLLITRGFRASGQVTLSQARIKGRLVLGGPDAADSVTIQNTGKTLSAFGLHVAQAIVARRVTASGIIDLRYASCAVLEDEIACWPSRTEDPSRGDGSVSGRQYNRLLRHAVRNKEVRYSSGLLMDGFCYDVLEGSRDTAWKQRRQIFDRMVDWNRPQPYLQLAGVYARTGSIRDARQVQIARLNAFYRPVNPLRWILRLLIGYGYQPFLALAWLLAIFLVSGYVFARAAEHNQFTPVHPPKAESVSSSKCRPATYPCFQPYVFSLDTLFPPLSLKQRDYWMVNVGRARWVADWASSLSVIGWVIGLLIVAGFTNLVRKE